MRCWARRCQVASAARTRRGGSTLEAARCGDSVDAIASTNRLVGGSRALRALGGSSHASSRDRQERQGLLVAARIKNESLGGSAEHSPMSGHSPGRAAAGGCPRGPAGDPGPRVTRRTRGTHRSGRHRQLSTTRCQRRAVRRQLRQGRGVPPSTGSIRWLCEERSSSVGMAQGNPAFAILTRPRQGQLR